MTTTANPEAELFVSTSKAFLAKHSPIGEVRRLHENGLAFDDRWWRQATELGWTALLVPEELGGGSVSESGLADLAAVVREMGAVVAPGPLQPVSIVLAALADSNETVDHSEAVESLMSGVAVASWATYEPGHPFDPAHPKTTATTTTTGYRIDGIKDRVEAGQECDQFLVTAALDGGGVLQFLIPAGQSGVTIEAQSSVDLVKNYARVIFDGVEVSPDAVVSDPEHTPDLIERQTQIALVLQCAELTGLLGKVFEFTVQWGFDRYSFGRPLASYQALKHRFADMKMWLEACRGTTDAAVAAVGSRSPDAAVAVSVAKSYVGEKAPVLVQDCIQLHGGIGVTWEHDLHLYLRRVTLYRALFGTPAEHNQRVYDLLAPSTAGGTR